MYRTVFWTLWERARVGWFWRMALNHVYYHMWNESPVQVRCMKQGSWGWCTGDDPEGWDGEECRRWGQDGEHMYTHGRFMPMYGKTTTVLWSNKPPIKINKFILKKKKNKKNTNKHPALMDYFGVSSSECPPNYSSMSYFRVYSKWN